MRALVDNISPIQHYRDIGVESSGHQHHVLWEVKVNSHFVGRIGEVIEEGNCPENFPYTYYLQFDDGKRNSFHEHELVFLK